MVVHRRLFIGQERSWKRGRQYLRKTHLSRSQTISVPNMMTRCWPRPPWKLWEEHIQKSPLVFPLIRVNSPMSFSFPYLACCCSYKLKHWRVQSNIYWEPSKSFGLPVNSITYIVELGITRYITEMNYGKSCCNSLSNFWDLLSTHSTTARSFSVCLFRWNSNESAEYDCWKQILHFHLFAW